MDTCGYRVVLSIDGGGIRGIIPLIMLDHIVENFRVIGHEVLIPDLVDLFVGTSTGTIISSGLMLKNPDGSMKYSVRDMLNMYMNRGHQIFNKSSGNSSHRYVYPFRLVLESSFGNYRMSDLKHNYMFVSYDLVENSPYFFKNNTEEQNATELSEVIMACSAVPGYFPPVRYRDRELADGMLTAKNPTKHAYEYARELFPNDKLLVVSLGTGSCVTKKADWIDSEVVKTHSYMKKQMDFDQNLIYVRLQPDLLIANESIDDTSDENISGLVNDSVNYLRAATPKFDRLFNLMTIKLSA